MNLEKNIKWYIITVSMITGFFVNDLLTKAGTEHWGFSLLTLGIIIMNSILVNKNMKKLTKKD